VPTSEPDKRLRAELAAELGWYPADLDDESIARHRADAARKKTDRDPVATLTENMARLRHKTVEAARARGYDRFVFFWEVEPPSGFTLGGK
jgi:hypothetical protein